MALAQSCAAGGSVAGGRTCAGTGTSPPDGLAGAGAVATVAVGVAEGLGAAGAWEEHAHSSAASALAAAAQLPLHRRGDLVSGKVIEPVIVRSHALGEVCASVDRVRLVHRSYPREVLDRGQVAVVASRVDDQRV